MKEAKTALKPVALDPKNMDRGDDGDLYHLPTLRLLLAAGRLSHDSAGYRLLMQHAASSQPRLIA